MPRRKPKAVSEADIDRIAGRATLSEGSATPAVTEPAPAPIAPPVVQVAPTPVPAPVQQAVPVQAAVAVQPQVYAPAPVVEPQQIQVAVQGGVGQGDSIQAASSGRPTHKEEGVDYVRINIAIPKHVKQKLMYRVADGEFLSLQHAVNEALGNFIG